MNAPVDVLLAAVKRIGITAPLFLDGERVSITERDVMRLSERDAAVAELIDKADNAATALSNLIAAGQVDARYGDYVTELTAALARVHPMTREQQAEQAGVRA